MARSTKDSPEGLFVPAGVLIGMGVGFLLGNLVPYMFIGLGAGFLFFAFAAISKNKS